MGVTEFPDRVVQDHRDYEHSTQTLDDLPVEKFLADNGAEKSGTFRKMMSHFEDQSFRAGEASRYLSYEGRTEQAVVYRPQLKYTGGTGDSPTEVSVEDLRSEDVSEQTTHFVGMRFQVTTERPWLAAALDRQHLLKDDVSVNWSDVPSVRENVVRISPQEARRMANEAYKSEITADTMNAVKAITNTVKHDQSWSSDDA